KLEPALAFPDYRLLPTYSQPDLTTRCFGESFSDRATQPFLRRQRRDDEVELQLIQPAQSGIEPRSQDSPISPSAPIEPRRSMNVPSAWQQSAYPLLRPFLHRIREGFLPPVGQG